MKVKNGVLIKIELEDMENPEYMKDGAFTIPEGITAIGEGRMQIVDTVLSLDDDTEFAQKVRKIIIPKTVKEIGAQAFAEHFPNLVKVTFEECSELERIEESAFYGCHSLSSIEIPESVTRIGADAFRRCERLRSITFPKNSTTVIGDKSFEGCQFEECHFLGEIATCDYMTEQDKKGIINSYVYNEKKAIVLDKRFIKHEEFGQVKSFTVPNGVNQIGERCFCNWNELEELTIPGSVERIEEGIFNFQLRKVILEEGVKSIGDNAFSVCEDLESIYLPKSITHIGKQAFFRCKALQFVEIPENVKEINDGTFYQSGVRWVKLPEKLKRIGKKAFFSCMGLERINWPENLTDIDREAFYCCYSLKSAEIPDNVTHIDYATFYGCGLKKLKLSSKLETIGTDAFHNCENLRRVQLPQSLRRIERGAFGSCKGLTDVSMHSQISDLGYMVFWNCQNLKNVMIIGSEKSQELIDKLKDNNFEILGDCDKLEKITVIPDEKAKKIRHMKIAEVINEIDIKSLRPAKLSEAKKIIDEEVEKDNQNDEH